MTKSSRLIPGFKFQDKNTWHGTVWLHLKALVWTFQLCISLVTKWDAILMKQISILLASWITTSLITLYQGSSMNLSHRSIQQWYELSSRAHWYSKLDRQDYKRCTCTLHDNTWSDSFIFSSFNCESIKVKEVRLHMHNWSIHSLLYLVTNIAIPVIRMKQPRKRQCGCDDVRQLL